MAHRIVDPLPRGQDVDYVACFDALARVQVAIRRRGPSGHLLLRRSMLESAIGNYASALAAARDAVSAVPRDPEAHFQEGLAWLSLARVQVGGAPLAPGTDPPPPRPLRTLVHNAYDAFCSALSCAGDDPDAEAACTYLEGLLRLGDTEMADVLREQG